MSASADSLSAGRHPPARLRGITKRYGDQLALAGIDLTIDRAGVTALLGPNGAGKTTLVKILLGLAAPTTGTVEVFGMNPRDANGRALIGAMLQVGKVPDTLRVHELIDEFRAFYPRPLEHRELVTLAGLDALRTRAYGTLSGGEKQRVLFALALAGDPALLVLDEPTVGFDVESRRGFWEGISRLARTGRSILLTTHYLEEADALADRIVVIQRGSIIADGTRSDIKARAASRRIRCVTRLDEASLAALPGVRSVRRLGAQTEILATGAEAVLREMLWADPDLSELTVSDGGLEEAFLALTSSPESIPGSAMEAITS